MQIGAPESRPFIIENARDRRRWLRNFVAFEKQETNRAFDIPFPSESRRSEPRTRVGGRVVFLKRLKNFK
jgi:hypothetical protein